MNTDRLSNMLSTIKNVSYGTKGAAEVPYTRLCEDVAKVMKTRGFLKELKVFKTGAKKMLHIDLATPGTKIDIRRISTPGNRQYRGATQLGKIQHYGGAVIVSTSRGVMEYREAKKKKLGGEVICIVY